MVLATLARGAECSGCGRVAPPLVVRARCRRFRAMIAGLLLAAGYGRRFGGNKLCAKLNGKAIVRSSADVLAPTDALYVLGPPAPDHLPPPLPLPTPTFVVNPPRPEAI